MLIILFLFGLIIGSFLNVLVLRFETNETLGGRSHCPKCQTLIHWYDNIPVVSYVWLWGKCRSCGAGIHWQYPAVELSTALLFALVGWRFGDGVVAALLAGGMMQNLLGFEVTLSLAGMLFLTSLLVAIVTTDLRTMSIPVVWLLTSTLSALVLALFIGAIPVLRQLFDVPSWSSAMVAGSIAAGLFWLLVFFSHETWMGMGDVWVAGILGLLAGVEFLLPGLTLAFCLGALVGVGLLVMKRKNLKSQIPFTPFLVMAIFLLWVLQAWQPAWLPLFAPLQGLL